MTAQMQRLYHSSPASVAGDDTTSDQKIKFQFLQTHDSVWQPSSTSPAVAMNLRLDGRIVASPALGARVSYSHLVVLDDFLDAARCGALLAWLTEEGWSSGPQAASGPPPDKWERRTADQAGLPPTWGLNDAMLRRLATAELPAMREVHTRLARLYPDMDIAHMPSDAIQRLTPSPSCDPVQQRREQPHGAGNGAHQQPGQVDCNQFVANAAVYGDCFQWHEDADPAGFPTPSPWTQQFEVYCNGEPGRPLLVSLLLYLDERWLREWDAETLFLDAATDTGVFVRPKCGRAVLMDQDVLHRVSAPSQLAGGRPRYSLVWKLVLLPKTPDQTCCISRPDWGRVTSFGSAAKLDAVKRAMATISA